MASRTRQIADLLKSVCSIDSRTVEGADGTTRVAEIFAERLAAMAFEITWVNLSAEEGRRGRHLMAVRHAEAPCKLILLGHTDTVLGPDEAPFRYDPQFDRFFGAGVCDMKGGCVVMLEAIEQSLEQMAAVRDAGLVVLLNCAEEKAGISFRQLVRDAVVGGRACLTFEPARLGPDNTRQIVTARKGVVNAKLKCTGRASHAGNAHPWGVNAIREIARKIEAIEMMTNHHQQLTTNVGIVEGGYATNQIASHATISFEIRAFDRDVLNRALEAFDASCNMPTVASQADGAMTQLELATYEAFPPWKESDASHALADQYVRIALSRGIAVGTTCSGGGSDASHVADLLPTLDGLGVLGGGMHSQDEWADAESLVTHADLAADLICEICSRV